MVWTTVFFIHLITADPHILLRFLPCDALQCKARSCYGMSSVCPSIHLSVTLVDHDHIGWKSWKLTAWAISPTSSLFVSQRSFTYSQEIIEKLGGDYGGVGKSGVLEHKSSNISEIEEKLLWRACGKSPTLFRFFGSLPYFCFRFRLCGHRDGRFCLIFARTAQQSVLDATNGLSSFKPCAYCRIVHCVDIFAIAQLSCCNCMLQIGLLLTLLLILF